jgi:hypothetical protein
LFVARAGDGGRAARTLHMFGQEAVIWSAAGRTYVLVSDQPKARMETLAAMLRKELRTR